MHKANDISASADDWGLPRGVQVGDIHAVVEPPERKTAQYAGRYAAPAAQRRDMSAAHSEASMIAAFDRAIQSLDFEVPVTVRMACKMELSAQSVSELRACAEQDPDAWAIRFSRMGLPPSIAQAVRAHLLNA
jgi:hypothetical protein